MHTIDFEKIRIIVNGYQVVLFLVLEKVGGNLGPWTVWNFVAYQWLSLLLWSERSTYFTPGDVFFVVIAHVRPIDAFAGSSQR